MDNLKRRKIILKREIQCCIEDEMSQIQRGTVTHLEEFFTTCINMSNVGFRIIWLVVGICCFSSCIYQIGDRIAYYKSRPVRTDVETNDKPFTMPPFSISGVDTAALRNYWNLLEGKEDPYFQFRQNIPSIAFNLPHNVSINYTEFWLATNVTPNFERIRVLDTNNILTDIHLESGRITDELTNSTVIAWSELNKIVGSATLFKMNNKINLKTEVIIQVRYTGYHPGSFITFTIDNLLPFHDYITTDFGQTMGQTMTLTYSIKKYEFLNIHQSPCEPREEIGEQCFRKCLTKIFENYSCWLPFMPTDVNTVDCSELKKSTVASIAYQSSFNVLQTISPKINCSCQKSCTDTKLYLKVDQKNTEDKSRITLVYKNRESIETEITQKLAYDTISLLVDIGGTMGLFLGLSVSSIFKLVQLGSFYLSKSIKHPPNGKLTKYKYNLRVRTELSRLLQKRITDQKNPKSFKWLKIFVIMVLTVFSTLLMYLQIEYFFSYPTKIVIKLEDDDMIHLPNIIACGQGEQITRIKTIVANIEKVDQCQVDTLDLIDHVNIGNSNTSKVEAIWQAQKISWGISVPNGYNVNWIDMYTGNCLEIKFEPKPFVGVSSIVIVQLKTSGNIICEQSLFQLYFRSPEINYHSLIFNQVDLLSGLHSAAKIETHKYEHHNSAVKPCVEYQRYDECRLNCYRYKMQLLIQCRLPFIDISKPFCNSSANAKEASYTYLKIVLSSNVQLECNCIRPCVETIYKITWGFNNVMPNNPLYTKIHVITLSNLIEYVTEISLRSFIGLWCMLGNILGVTLGLSVLSTFQGMFIYFNNIMKNGILKDK